MYINAIMPDTPGKSDSFFFRRNTYAYAHQRYC